MATTPLDVVITFADAHQVSKQIDLEGSTNFKVYETQAYGEGEWFEIEISMDGIEDIQLHELVIGGTTENFRFAEG